MNLNPDDFILMRQIDTLHDFWSNQRGDDIQAILRDFPILKDTITRIKEGDLKNNRVSLSTIENSFAAYFEEKIPLESIADNTIITIDPTDTSINNANNLNNYVNNKAIQIIIPSDIDENYDLTYIGEFIRKFMVGNDKTIGFVIDANHGKLPQIFKTDPAVKTVIDALVVADSANTPKEHNNSNFYERWTPNMFPSDEPLANFTVTSPFFSEKIVKMYYEENAPGSFASNITAFKLIVESKDNPAIKFGEAYFSPTTTQGAGVDTLKKLIQFVDGDKNMNELNNLEYKSNQLDIRPIIRGMKQNRKSNNDIINFLLDYKRAGDYEQVNSARKLREMGNKIIFSTGDELCALYARSQGVPCIYNHVGKLDLYAFEKSPETAEERLAKYTERKNYYAKYQAFFNSINPESLGLSIGAYFVNIEAYVRERINAPMIIPFIEYSLAGYRKTLDVEVLRYINESLNAIVGELDTKITNLESDIDFNPENYKQTSEYTANVNKIQVFLTIADKIVEQPQDITPENVSVLIAKQGEKIYEADNSIFGFTFDSHDLLAKTYTNFEKNTITETKIEKISINVEKAKIELERLKTEKIGQTDKRALDKLNPRIDSASANVLKAEKALYNAKENYENALMAQIDTMNKEIIKILETYDENMNLTKDGDESLTGRFNTAFAKFNENYQKEKTTISGIVVAYKETFMRDFQETLGPASFTPTQSNRASSVIAKASGTEAPGTEESMEMEGGGDERTKETIKLWTGLETALMTLSDYSETMFNALYKDFQRDCKDSTLEKFLAYLEYIYEESYTWKQEDEKPEEKKTEEEKQKSFTNLREFKIPKIDGVIFESVKTDYIKYINELRSEFNVALNEIIPPELTIDEFYFEISAILEKTGFANFIKLLYNEKREEEEIDLLKLYHITCVVKDKEIKRKFTNFDKVEVDTILEETFVGGVGTPAQSGRKFLTAARRVRSMNNTIRKFKDFKGLKEHIIKKTEDKNKKTQRKWQSLIESSPKVSSEIKVGEKRPRSPSGTSEEARIINATVEMPRPMETEEEEERLSVPSVPDITDSHNKPESIEGQPVRKRLKIGSSTSEYDLGGGKRTRKHKNKRNKKTRHRNKKTLKNKTLKKRREKRKHRTRRN